jgi:hypothetical protein
VCELIAGFGYTRVYNLAGADLGKETTGGHTALDSASILPVLKYLRVVTEARRFA